MSDTQAKQNTIPSNPDFTDALNMLKKEILLLFSAHHIATVRSFSPVTQTATATINYKKTYFQKNEVGAYVPVLRDYPVMIDCPVIFLGGGKSAMTFPVTVGDECLAVFNDRDFDNWFQGSNNAPVATGRLHSFSDAILLVGLRSLANTLSTFDLLRAVLRGGSAVVGVNAFSSKVLITNSAPIGAAGNYVYPITLGTILGVFFAATAAATTVSQIAAAAATAETALAGLLE